MYIERGLTNTNALNKRTLHIHIVLLLYGGKCALSYQLHFAFSKEVNCYFYLVLFPGHKKRCYLSILDCI